MPCSTKASNSLGRRHGAACNGLMLRRGLLLLISVAFVCVTEPSESIRTLEAALKQAYSTWLQKRDYAGRLDWVPKYTESEVGIKHFISTDGFDGVVKATWADFIVHEVRLRDGEIVSLSDRRHEEERNKDEDEGMEERQESKHGHMRADNKTGERLPSNERRGDTFRGLRFVLCKMGMDTITAVRSIASACHIPYTNFRFAGIKDKYGVTTQEVTVHGVSAAKLQRFNSMNHLRQIGGKIIISDIERCSAPLHSGELHGNRFVIVVRNVTASREALRKSVASLRKRGFINYFGMQRFGGGSVDSIAAGRALLNSDTNTFAKLLFSPERASDRKEINVKKRFNKDKNMKRALDNLPPYCTNERLFLQYRLQGRSESKAVSAIPYRSMYEQSYTSALWNEACSVRVEAYGLKPVVGDIVLLATKGGGVLGKKSQTVKVLSRADVKARTHSMSDVVLPMVTGDRKVVLPRNKVGRWMRKKLKAEGLADIIHVLPYEENDDSDSKERPGLTLQGTFDHHNEEVLSDEGESENTHQKEDSIVKENPIKVEHNIADFDSDRGGKNDQRLSGRKRKRAEESLSSKIPKASDKNGPQLVKQMCKFRPVIVKPKELRSCTRRYGRADEMVFSGDENTIIDGGEGAHKGMVLAFTLPAGAYATMLLRELMHGDSSWASHHKVMRELLDADCTEEEKAVTAQRQKKASKLLRAKRRKALKRKKAFQTALDELPLSKFFGTSTKTTIL